MKLNITISVLLLSAASLFGLELPDGTVVDPQVIEKNDSDRIFNFRTPVEIPSPSGPLPVIYVEYDENYKNKPRFCTLAPGAKLKTASGTFPADLVRFKVSEEGSFLEDFRLTGTVKIPTIFGPLTLDAGAYIYLSPEGKITHVYIFSGKTGEIQAGRQKWKVKETVSVDGVSALHYGYPRLIFAEPAKLKTSFGQHTYSEAVFTSEGVPLYGTFSTPQKIKTPVGEVLATEFRTYKNGALEFVYLSGDEETVMTPWGKKAVTRVINFNDDGWFRQGWFSDPFDYEYSFGSVTLSDVFYIHKEKINVGLVFPVEIATPAGVFFVEWRLSVSHQGELLEVTPVDAVRVQTPMGEIIHKRGKVLGFSEEGVVVAVFPDKETELKTPFGTVKILPISDYTATRFYPDGSLKYFGTMQTLTVDSSAGKVSVTGYISLFPDGKLKSGELAAPITLSGRRFGKGEEIKFDDNRILIIPEEVEIIPGH